MLSTLKGVSWSDRNQSFDGAYKPALRQAQDERMHDSGCTAQDSEWNLRTY